MAKQCTDSHTHTHTHKHGKTHTTTTHTHRLPHTHGNTHTHTDTQTRSLTHRHTQDSAVKLFLLSSHLSPPRIDNDVPPTRSPGNAAVPGSKVWRNAAGSQTENAPA